ncbi:SAM-dependent methyltransferase [Qaidamihabitans albus]|uniref:SAM-dependent methyltransferase n=1 Tax=Qaidamihabitans albus TaxID=2795733 RepID=UPI0018F14968|nr:SAM-dependent methyltransferase [Qaidamihabitans albus]
MPDDKPPLDLDRPSSGRVYDYWLGGTNNYAIDREFAERQLELAPEIRDAAMANRAFLGRAVRYATESGIRQFVDIGSGLPTQGNVHEVADDVAPGEARVVYVDNEPVAHAHSQILLESTADLARHHALWGDFFDGPELWQRILDEGGIDPEQPVCLFTVALLHLLPAERQPERILSFYRDQLAPGSLLVLSHAYFDPADEQAQAALRRIAANYAKQTVNQGGGMRSREDIAELFGDFVLVEPGLVSASQWRRDTASDDGPAHTPVLAGVGRKR